MRISTNQIYSNGVGGLQNLTGSLYSLQNQISTGRRIVTPQDDPVGSAQALLVSQAKSVNELYVKNQETAETKLGSLDNVLSGVNDELQSIYEKAVAAGNGTYSDSERAGIAVELKQRLTSILALANSQDGAGRYIFAGFESTTPPFTQNATSVSPYSLTQTYVDYNGDDGVLRLQISASEDMATNEPGSSVFMRIADATGVPTGRSMFDSIQNLVDLLNTPGAVSANPAYSQALSDILSSIETVSRSRASVGARMSSLETLGTVTQGRGVEYDAQLSSLRDLDYAKAISEVTQKKIQLEAAQATFSQTAKLSLFQYI
ncbi:flagellar hook-associated protein FlgL [Azonexus sp. IMCC34839]|uniref:flagellar hook-associated protein FlgL n=1 Tax=Azonexus sp. IMCC34839 TaxID=3133695 RepID=UPI00399A97CB